MVFSIDKLDGSIVCLCADFVTMKKTQEDYLVEFTKVIFDGEDGDGKRKVVTRTVGAYWLSNICGFREVIGMTDEDLEQMFKEDAVAMNKNGEYCAKNGDDYEEITT